MFRYQSPLKSKKFVAYTFSNSCLKSYIFFATLRHEGDIVILAAIICSVFLDVGYILGQSYVDKYVHMAESLVKKSHEKEDQ